MKKQSILFKRIKFNGPPLRISEKGEIYYVEKKKRVVIEKLPFLDENFLKFKLEKENQGRYKIVVEIHDRKFNKIVGGMYNLKNRKTLFNIFKNCHYEMMNNYASHLTVNLLEEILENTKVDNLNRWVKSRESDGKQLHNLPDLVFKFGDYCVDVDQGRIGTSTQKEEFTLCGGIIIDVGNQSWVEKMVDAIKDGPSLIVVDTLMCNFWKLNTTGKKVVIIRNRKDHSGVTYQDLVDSDIVIMSSEYINSRQYSDLWTDYDINNNSVRNIFQIIAQENLSNKRFYERFFPIISLLTWGRLIIDHRTFSLMEKNLKFNELISTIDSRCRWLHLSNYNPTNNKDYLRYLTNNGLINYPIYHGDDFYMPNDLVRVVDNKNVGEQIIHQIEPPDLLADILELSGDDPKTEIALIDSLILNSDPDVELSDGECQICQDVLHNQVQTRCNHHFCLKCIISNLHFNNRCPICRREIDRNKFFINGKIHHDIGNIYTTMVDELFRVNGKTLLILNDLNIVDHVENLLEKQGISNNKSTGNRNKRMEQFVTFNDDASKVLIILASDIEMIKLCSSVENIFTPFRVDLQHSGSIHHFIYGIE